MEEHGARFRNSTLLNHGSWRISVPRLCTMQGPGIAVESRLDPRRLAATNRATFHILCPKSWKIRHQTTLPPQSEEQNPEASDPLPQIATLPVADDILQFSESKEIRDNELWSGPGNGLIGGRRSFDHGSSLTYIAVDFSPFFGFIPTVPQKNSKIYST